MRYFDTAFIVKCYLNEPGGERVRQAVRETSGAFSCEIARLEFASALWRSQLTGRITASQKQAKLDQFEQDERSGVWRWLPLNSALVESARSAFQGLPAGTFLRAADALHLACARQHGFPQIFSSDRHLLAAAPQFQLEGVNLLALGDD